ncbi:MAG TPA: TfoX/Sxy family protein [Rubrivivax sp.]
MRPAPRDEFVELCLELLAALGSVRSRRMFGAHGLYAGELFFGIVASDRLYLKADAETKLQFATAGCEPFVHVARGRRVEMNFWTVPDEAMESPSLMQPWGRLALRAARAASKPPGVKRKPATRASATGVAPRTSAPRKRAVRP